MFSLICTYQCDSEGVVKMNYYYKSCSESKHISCVENVLGHGSVFWPVYIKCLWKAAALLGVHGLSVNACCTVLLFI